MSRSFLMTTSPTIEGSEIEHYFGIVATNVVTGTGVFSDVAAAFSDFFGGRSNSYKKQLESIREEALKEIESKARSMGANAESPIWIILLAIGACLYVFQKVLLDLLVKDEVKEEK